MIALVTGASRGIGREVAAQLTALGHIVVATDRKQLDVTDPASIAATAAEVDRGYGRLDVLVNNAGISGGPDDRPHSTDLDRVREIFETNLFGVMAVTNAMLPLLRKSEHGRIVNVSSGTGSLAWMTDPAHYFAAVPASAAYPVSKTALNMLTVQYAKDLPGILVNAAAPGACDTDFTKAFQERTGRVITRTAADGAAIVVKLATLDDDGPTGGFFDDNGPVPW
ncbi:SDR family NAD(P)-dependent oxidoreductase [Fodinicola acaciae]|uniref:SDR family NAD(P)-dependent oxidoreductase n=1 Tax=Fodinicola acaciae TaxID=2681555 RepID=UPI0013D03F63|nr:SDR family NAD(P)-dependent oxidoreductase [Fodinicola acaciae]